MENNYSHFAHRLCEYFPCHAMWKETGRDETEFNCLFCYCPLYLRENCPGNPSYFVDRTGQRIKDCSQCIFPHLPENYEKVLQCLTSQEELIHIESTELDERIRMRMEESCRFQEMETEAAKQQRQEANLIYEKFLKHRSIDILLHPFDRSCVGRTAFRFGTEEISCSVLERIETDWIQQGYLYAFHAPMLRLQGEELTLLQQFYIESWQIAMLDAARDWLQEYLARRHSVRKQAYVTDSFGPGFYGMQMDALEKLCNCLDLKRAGIALTENGNLKPLKSIVGLHLVSDRDVAPVIRDCSSCLGNLGGCTLCRRGGGR